MTESTTIRWEQDDTGVVTLVLDDPNQSANTMNAAFRESLTAITDRLEAERDSIRGIIVTSAKKTFFAAWRPSRPHPCHPGHRPGVLRRRPRHQEEPAPHRDPRQAGRRRDERRGPGRRLRTRPRLPPPHRPRRARLQDRLPRSHPRPPPRRRRSRPYGTAVGHRRRPAEGAPPGHPVQPATRPGERPRPRSGHHPGRVARQGPRLHRRQPRVAAALGQARLPHPGRHPRQPQVRGQPARLPRHPAQADQRRALPGAAQHPRRRRRGRPGRLRDRPGHRDPLLRRAGGRPDLEEHDPGVLLRPSGRQLRRQPPPGHPPARSARPPSSAPG